MHTGTCTLYMDTGIGNNDNSVLAFSDHYVHYEIAVSAISLEAVHDETVLPTSILQLLRLTCC